MLSYVYVYICVHVSAYINMCKCIYMYKHIEKKEFKFSKL